MAAVRTAHRQYTRRSSTTGAPPLPQVDDTAAIDSASLCSHIISKLNTALSSPSVQPRALGFIPGSILEEPFAERMSFSSEVKPVLLALPPSATAFRRQGAAAKSAFGSPRARA